MRSPAVLPKSVLLVEIIGIVLLTLAWLSLNQYLQLPAPFSSPTAAMLMIFSGIPADAPGSDSINVANGQDRRATADSHSKTNFFTRQRKTR
ncbi:Protein of uncharacterised function (DUF1418) [Raoultella planticola]|uniref:Protein of uncharacterized function (DUF1418) n=1 Tax=Raoultella planticola TaxID=575 RepID=A0A485CDN7_RAOPL|nr:Protein of uncharacterised function (DUF1418) [Raoultella planticola]